jgi:hypothetical protein
MAERRMPELYINIGTVKSALFVRMSTFLIRRLEQYPLLYFAVEESLECAKNEYYGIGIIAFAQLLNVMNEETPDSRHLVAHEFLEHRPSKEAFDSAVEKFKKTAAQRSDQESIKYDSVEDYGRKIAQEWGTFITNLHNLAEAPLTI